MAGSSQPDLSRSADGVPFRPAPGGAGPAAPPEARVPPGRPERSRRWAGLLLMHLGFGGMLLSLLWDVLYKGGTFDPEAIGPFKLLGAAAGSAMAAAGITLALIPARKAVGVRQAAERTVAARAYPGAVAAPGPAGGRPGATARGGPPPADEIPEALPVVDGIPVAPGTAVLEAVPVDQAPRPVAYRPPNPR